MHPDATAGAAEGNGHFQTTRWSLILSSFDPGTDEEKARAALAQLCRIYWRPIFAFICSRGHSVADAQDWTQEFFLMVLKGELFSRAHPKLGRFRSLLLRSLQNFLYDAHTKVTRQKRGGELQFISWDDWMAEAPSQLTLPVTAFESWAPERIFDVRWAATLAENALRRLQEECESRDRRRLFDVLSPSLTAERNEVSYDTLARELGVGLPETKNALHRLRQRYRQFLREEVAATVENPEDIDDELRYLVAALAAGMEQTATSA